MSVYDELQKLKRDGLFRNGWDCNPTVGGMILPFDWLVANIMNCVSVLLCRPYGTLFELLLWLLPICCPYGTHWRQLVHGFRCCNCSDNMILPFSIVWLLMLWTAYLFFCAVPTGLCSHSYLWLLQICCPYGTHLRQLVYRFRCCNCSDNMILPFRLFGC